MKNKENTEIEEHKEKIKKRISLVLSSLKIRQVEVVEKTGISKQQVNRMFVGEGSTGLSVILRLIEIEEKINLHWVITGEGEMMLGEKNIQEPSVGYGKKNLEKQLEECRDQCRFLRDETVHHREQVAFLKNLLEENQSR
jgi:hypothetical protein